MSSLYLESSALLRGVLERDRVMAGLLRDWEGPAVASALTFLEAHRALAQARVAGRITAARAEVLAAEVDAVERRGEVLPVDVRVLAAARTMFPVEPVRSLDAIHLATIRLLADAVDALVVASVDRRVRANVRALGLRLVPGDVAGVTEPEEEWLGRAPSTEPAPTRRPRAVRATPRGRRSR